MVSTTAFTQANLQHSITASRVLTRTETWHWYGNHGITKAILWA